MLKGKAYNHQGSIVVEVEGHTESYICSAVSTLMQTFVVLGGKAELWKDGSMRVVVPPYEIDEDLFTYGEFMITGILLISKDERSQGKFEFTVEKEDQC